MFRAIKKALSYLRWSWYYEWNCKECDIGSGYPCPFGTECNKEEFVKNKLK